MPSPVDLGQRLTGARVVRLGRRAKYGLIETDRGDTLVFHLGMSGRWRIDPAEIGKHDHLLLDTDEGRRLALNDAPAVRIAQPRADRTYWPNGQSSRRLGPEPLDVTPEELKRRLAGRSASIKLLLLDQSIIAGLGNIYVCEALCRAGIHPARAGGSISLERIKRWFRNPRRARGSDRGRRVNAEGFRLAQRGARYFSKSFAVYDREGRLCTCGAVVKRIVQGGRSTFYCPRCQR